MGVTAEVIKERSQRIRERKRQHKAEKRELARDWRDSMKEKSLASIADSLEKIAAAVEDEEGWLVRAILQHATVMKHDVATALSSIAHRSQGGGRGNGKK